MLKLKVFYFYQQRYYWSTVLLYSYTFGYLSPDLISYGGIFLPDLIDGHNLNSLSLESNWWKFYFLQIWEPLITHRILEWPKGWWSCFGTYSVPKRYLISPTNSLTFSKTEDCRAVKQNFPRFTVIFYCILAHFWNVCPKIVIIPTNFTGKQKICLIISLETMIWGK